MKSFSGILITFLIIAGFILFLWMPRAIVIEPANQTKNSDDIKIIENLPSIPESEKPETNSVVLSNSNSGDIENQPHLSNPPEIVRGLYLTGWTAGSPKRVSSIIAIMKKNNLNSVVVDVKDYSGYVSYYTGIPLVKTSGAENEIRIPRPNAMIKSFHDNEIYVIARITIFQDPVLSHTHPEWAIKNSETGNLWKDRKGLSWMDPAAKPVWDYNIMIAKDAIARGFDEVQLDYIRFPSDGNLKLTAYPFWDEEKSMFNVISDFFTYFREQMKNAKISADIFGLTTVAYDDLGIGQRIEDAYKNFDYVSPMVYPSHFANGFIGYQNPAEHPYEVIKHSMQGAVNRLNTLLHGPFLASSTTSTRALTYSKPVGKLRPWLQVFDLGAIYDSVMVQAQIKAAEDVLKSSNQGFYYAGYLLWDPKNSYTSL
jgi:hypothetical protein